MFICLLLLPQLYAFIIGLVKIIPSYSIDFKPLDMLLERFVFTNFDIL